MKNFTFVDKFRVVYDHKHWKEKRVYRAWKHNVSGVILYEYNSYITSDYGGETHRHVWTMTAEEWSTTDSLAGWLHFINRYILYTEWKETNA